MVRRRSTVRFRNGAPDQDDNSNASNSAEGPFRGPSDVLGRQTQMPAGRSSSAIALRLRAVPRLPPRCPVRGKHSRASTGRIFHPQCPERSSKNLTQELLGAAGSPSVRLVLLSVAIGLSTEELCP
jgi:hypothetical protein